MTLEKLWDKLEAEEVLTTREEKTFTDEITHGIDKLEDVMEDSKDAE